MIDDNDNRDGVRSVDRALRILEIVAEDAQGMRLRDIAARASLPPSTCHRLLAAMEHRHFVHFSRRSTVWHIGRGAFRVGAAFVRKRAFVVPALPTMRALRDASGETVNIGSPEDGNIVILAQIESREVVRAINIIGGRAPLSTSALGKAVLASYDDATLQGHVERYGLPSCTARSITAIDALRGDLRETRRRGFAVDCEEHLSGLHCVAAPIFDGAGDAIASLSVSGLAGRLGNGQIEKLGDRVARAADQLTREQGGVASDRWRIVS